ncbi:response regulator [Pigmentibacter ruber]|uniref:chemotaxis protein CheV n=1 Tax=Pigmentibacter ruber TaxID=2683196 RepID=UPI00131A781A|nr:response regulator [Pigmentibacter ruber]BFD31933.1 chemotaxis protein [Pigmentibacter ruber]
MINNEQLLNTIDGKTIIILPFSLRNEENELHLALNVQKISAVFEESQYSLLPGVMPPFVYMIDMHGKPIPVLDISKIIKEQYFTKQDASKANEKKKNVKKRIIICHVLSILVGIIVDATRKIKTVPNSQVLPPPELWNDNESFFVSGIIQENGIYRYLFDIEKYLSTLGMNIGKLHTEKKELSINFKGKKGLVVEDSKVYQLLAKKFFEKYEMQLDLASNGKEGLNLLLENHYDFVITDIEMPMMNGIDMIREYKSNHTSDVMPIIFHSSISNSELSKDLEKDKLGIMITKFSEDVLLDSLTKILKN